MQTTTRSTRRLRHGALALAAAILLLWAGFGAHTGWTRTSVTELQNDALTGLDYPVEVRRFVPGVELLAAGLGSAAALFALSAILERRRA